METNVALVCINRIIYFSLAGAYGLLGLAIFIQLIRIQKRVPEYGWTTQKVDELGKIFDAFARDVFSPPPPPFLFFSVIRGQCVPTSMCSMMTMVMTFFPLWFMVCAFPGVPLVGFFAMRLQGGRIWFQNND